MLVILFIGNNNSDMWKSILGVFAGAEMRSSKETRYWRCEQKSATDDGEGETVFTLHLRQNFLHADEVLRGLFERSRNFRVQVSPSNDTKFLGLRAKNISPFFSLSFPRPALAVTTTRRKCCLLSHRERTPPTFLEKKNLRL